MTSDEERKRRFLREANERIRLVNAKFAVTDGNVELFCECGANGCMELLQVPASAYDYARGDKQLFLSRPGHEQLGVESVEAHGQAYLVVRSHRNAADRPDARNPIPQPVSQS
jgi:hypothetical protein